MSTITRAEVEQLRSEAAVAGDEGMVAICDEALADERDEYSRGDSRFGDSAGHAWRRCLNAVEYARGQS